MNPTLDELKALLGTTLTIEATTPDLLAASWTSTDGGLVRSFGHAPLTTLAAPDLFASRTEMDLGLAGNPVLA